MMKRNASKVAGIVVAISFVTALASAPVGAANSNADGNNGRGLAIGSANEAVREILAEAGLGPTKLAASEDRMSKGLVRLVEAGIIEDANVEELVSLAKQGGLGPIISARAKATSNGRSDEARADRKPTDPGSQGNDKADPTQGKPDDPGSAGSNASDRDKPNATAAQNGQNGADDDQP